MHTDWRITADDAWRQGGDGDPQTLLIAGSRDIPEAVAYQAIEQAYWMLEGFAPDVLITGDARGVDTWGQKWWQNVLGGPETIEHHPAEWEKHGRAAGYIRNADMAGVTDQAIIVWDGESKGTAHMIQQLEALGTEYVLVLVTPDGLRFQYNEGGDNG